MRIEIEVWVPIKTLTLHVIPKSNTSLHFDPVFYILILKVLPFPIKLLGLQIMEINGSKKDLTTRNVWNHMGYQLLVVMV